MKPALRPSAFYAHAGVFILATLIGIARFSQSVPVTLTVLMTVWTIGLVLHGLLVRQAQQDSQQPSDSIFRVVLWASGGNALLWSMWSLISDAGSASPWHVSVMLATLTVLICGAIFGQRALYARWERDHQMKQTDQRKPKRDETRTMHHLTDDGEIAETVEEDERRYSEAR